MDTTEIIHNALEWANKRLELQGEPITKNQRNYIVFALRQQLTIPAVLESDDFVNRSSLIEQISKTDEYYRKEGRYQYSDGLNKARYLVARHGKKESL